MKFSAMDADGLWKVCRGERAAVMAILNVTGDSFYSDSRLGSSPEAVLHRVRQAVEEGADILDVGGYSSRPGAEDVSEKEEIRRCRVAMKVIREHFPGAAVSLDTFRSEVARTVMDEFGACIVNDISAGEADGRMFGLVAEKGIPYIAMHMRGTPATMASLTDYGGDVVSAVEDYFTRRLAELRERGIERVVIDPGFGFAKNVRQNYELLAALPRLAALGRPLLAGLSRKSMIYKVTGGGPADSLPGTAALNWQALQGGAGILRVHDVKAAADIIKLHEYYHGKQNDDPRCGNT